MGSITLLFVRMADLFLGGVDRSGDPRTTRPPTPSGHVAVATDSLTTHGVIVGMTGSGKTGLGVILIEEALRAGLPVLGDRPEGRPDEPVPDVPRPRPGRLPPVDRRGPGHATPARPPTSSPPARPTLWRDGLAGGGSAGADIGALRERTDFTIYTPGSQAGVALDIVGSLQVPADMNDAEAVADEIEGYVTGLLGLVGIAADPLASREHILLSNLIQHSWSEGRHLDLMTLVGMVPVAADPQARRVRRRPVLPRRRPHGAGDEAQRAAGVAVVRCRGRWGRRSTSHRCCTPRRARPLRDRHHRAPVRRRAPVRHVARSCRSSSRGCDARAARPTCGRCCTWTRSPATCRRPRSHRPRSRS